MLLFGVGGSFTSRIGLLFILFLQIGLCVLSVLCDVGMKNMCFFYLFLFLIRKSVWSRDQRIERCEQRFENNKVKWMYAKKTH